MSKEKPVRISMRLIFMILTMGELVFLAVLSWLVTELLHKYFSVIINIPDVVWFLAVCILIGGGIYRK